MSGRAAGSRRERGAAAVEVAILIPLIVLLIGMMSGGWRLWSARADVQRVADAAARAASLQRSGASAQEQARRVVALQTGAADSHCSRPSVEVDTSGFAVPAGEPAQVVVRLSCSVGLADLLVPGLPGSVTVAASSISVLDQYAERQP